jgi:hypothetical protein
MRLPFVLRRYSPRPGALFFDRDRRAQSAPPSRGEIGFADPSIQVTIPDNTGELEETIAAVASR